MSYAPQAHRFKPDLVYVSVYINRPDHITFPDLPDHRDSIARQQLAMRSLGASIASTLTGNRAGTPKIKSPIDFLQVTPVDYNGSRWLLISATGASFLATGANSDRISASLAQYESLPSQSVFLVTNSLANHKTGSDAESPWLPQANALLIQDSLEARRVANACIIEAVRQTGQQHVMNAWAKTAVPATGYAEYEVRGVTPIYGTDGRDFRVEVETTDRRTHRFWANELEGFSPKIRDFSDWVTHIWQPPEDTLRWRLITNPDSSARKTSGWVVYADAAGEYLEAGTEPAEYRMSKGHAFHQIGNALLFSVAREDVIPANMCLMAMRHGTPESVAVEIDSRDTVFSMNGKQPLFLGNDRTLYRLGIATENRPKDPIVTKTIVAFPQRMPG